MHTAAAPLTPSSNDRRAWLDYRYSAFIRTLRPALQDPARELPRELGCVPEADERFRHVEMLSLPSLLLPALSAARPGASGWATEAHFFGLLVARGHARIDAGKLDPFDPQAMVIAALRRARDDAFSRVAGSVTRRWLNFRSAENQAALSATSERRALKSGRLSLSRYHEIASGKQSVYLPGALALAVESGARSDLVGGIRDAIQQLALGFQFRDDAIDWAEDLAEGSAWPVRLWAGDSEFWTPEAATAFLRASGVLVEMHGLSRRAFQKSADLASWIGAPELARFAGDQADLAASLASGEARRHGAATRWERQRRAAIIEGQPALPTPSEQREERMIANQ